MAAARTCANCGAALRPQSRFCPKCATPVGGAAGPGGGGYTVRPRRTPPPIANPRQGGGTPSPGTFVKEESKRPGTVLYEDKGKSPVMGWLVIMRGKRRGTDFRISKESVTIGRDGSCDVALDDETASREHARIRKEKQKFVLFDLGSANGTYLNKKKVQRKNLSDGDVLRVGDTLLLFKEAKPGPQWDQAESKKDKGEAGDS